MTEDDGWVKKETSSEVTKLGDAPGQVAVVEGLFKGFREGKYGQLYVFEAADGSPIVLGGNAALDDTITEQDKGWLLRVEFKGWAESAGGNKYKLFDVYRKPGPGMGAAGDQAPPHEDKDAPSEDLPF